MARGAHDLDVRLPGQRHDRRDAVGKDDVEREDVVVEAPLRADEPVHRLQAGRRPGEAAAGAGRDPDAAVAGLERGDPADGAVHPVDDGAEGVVVEAGHLAGVDGAVGQHRVPALPDGRRTHGDRVEPRGAGPLQEEPVRRVEMPRLGQGVGDERACRRNRSRRGSRSRRRARPAGRRPGDGRRRRAGRRRSRGRRPTGRRCVIVPSAART